jgi:hypothetical protein
VVLKPAPGYGAQMQFRNNRLETVRPIDLDTEDVTEVPLILFLVGVTCGSRNSVPAP